MSLGTEERPDSLNEEGRDEKRVSTEREERRRSREERNTESTGT